ALLSGRTVVELAGAGARLRLDGSVVVAGGDAVRIDPGPRPPSPLTVQCLLAKNTFAVRRAVLHLADVPGLPTPAEPVVIPADNTLFLAPFTETPRRAPLLHCDGKALGRGLLLWQGANNGYDVQRLHGYVLSGATAPDGPQPHSAWARLWGTV